jgi:hypothetical protein
MRRQLVHLLLSSLESVFEDLALQLCLIFHLLSSGFLSLQLPL